MKGKSRAKFKAQDSPVKPSQQPQEQSASQSWNNSCTQNLGQQKHLKPVSMGKDVVGETVSISRGQPLLWQTWNDLWCNYILF